MIGIAAYNIASFVFEYDFFDARDLFGNENNAIKKIEKDLAERKEDVIEYLSGFDSAEAQELIEYIETI